MTGSLLLLGGLAAVRIVFYTVLWMGVGLQSEATMDEVVASLQIGSGVFAAELLLANALAQAVGLGGVAWLVAAWRPERAAWLRLGPARPGATPAAAIGLVGLLPAMQWLGALNTHLLPDAFGAADAAQHALFGALLSGDTAFEVARALVFLALTPAVFEEVFFRGALLRVWQDRGATWALMASSLAFAAFHLRIGQMLPLAVIGLYLGAVVLRTGSVRPAIAAHALYNAVLVGLAMTGAQGGKVPEPGALSVGMGLAAATAAMAWLFRHGAAPLAAPLTSFLPTDAGPDVSRREPPRRDR